ncbi:MAG: fused MFS/spermidine synthase, partial [Candidatus Omnitrophica bacterium]|nr:fused MFS/spermidine synthase [Candidatus Omnitrophota bacterium]
MVAASIIIIGVTAMASQIVFMRELLVVFYGNELSLGFILASWLLGGAVGSALLGRRADRISNKVTVFGLLQICAGILLPVEIVAIRAIKGALHIAPGQIMPLFPMIVSSLAILVPICAILGFLFSLGSRIYRSAGNVYVLEGAGAVIGGGLAGCILIKILNPVFMMAILAALNVAASLALLYFAGEKKFKKISVGIAAAIVIMLAALFFFKGWDTLEADSLKNEWNGYDLIASKNSVYGNIVLTKSLEQFSFFDNGLHLYSIPDPERAEGSVHFALLEHPDPKRVLLIGGGAGGSIGEVLKYPVDRVDYVELDPLLIEMTADYIPEEYSSFLLDERVGIKNTDGRFFIKRAPDKYDCIIINVGDPYTAQINRYYTDEFFKEAKRVLRPGGLISFGATSSENYINKELGEFLRSIYATVRRNFKDVFVIPGETAYFLATDAPGLLTYDYTVLMNRARARGIGLKYVREYYLSSRMSPQRIEDMGKIMLSTAAAEVNYDFRPISYYYNTAFWTTRFRDSLFTKIIDATNKKAVWLAILIAYCLIAFAGMILKFRKGSFGRLALLSLAGGGFTSMAVQIVLLLAFQIIYGYLFYKLAVNLTSFMLGLVVGGWYGTRLASKAKELLPALLAVQCAFAVYPLVLPVVFGWLNTSGSLAVSWAGQNVIFTLLPFLAGFIGGFQFPVANKIYAREEKNMGAAAGLTYGVDLIGSSLGALSIGAF